MKRFGAAMKRELAELVRRRHSPLTFLLAFATGAAIADPTPDWLGWAFMAALVASVLMTVD